MSLCLAENTTHYNGSRQNFHVRNKCTKISKLLDEKRGKKGILHRKQEVNRLYLLLLLFKVFFI